MNKTKFKKNFQNITYKPDPALINSSALLQSSWQIIR